MVAGIVFDTDWAACEEAVAADATPGINIAMMKSPSTKLIVLELGCFFMT